LMPVLSHMQLPPEVMLELMKYSPLPTTFINDMKKAMAAAQAGPKPPDPHIIEAQTRAQEAQTKLQVAQISAQTQQMRSQTDAATERARALGQVAQAKAESDKAGLEQQQIQASAFNTTAQGIKALADAQVEMQGPHFDALKMLMDALQREHENRQAIGQSSIDQMQQAQQMQQDSQAHAQDMQQSAEAHQADLANTNADTSATLNPPTPPGGGE